MNDRKKLSLILPAYNVADYIEACVESCEKQNIANDSYEVIIVNDGSTDSTPDIISRLARKYSNIKVVNQHNQGLSMARNNGFEVAVGEYIWFVDSDDTISENCLEDLLKVADGYNLDALVVGPSIPFVEYFPSDFDVKTMVTPLFENGAQFVCDGKWFVVGAWCYLLRRDFWSNNNLRFYPGIYFEDTELMPYAISKAKGIASLSKFSCYNYIQRQGSIMNSSISPKKIESNSVIVNSYMHHAESASVKALKEKFEAIATGAYLTALNGIADLGGNKKMLTDFLGSIDQRPKYIYANGMIGRLFQKFALTYPSLYVKVKGLMKK